jgi:GNAT superfamily N-acetyltransferase
MMTDIKIRIVKAEHQHIPRVVELMKELAEFEKLLDEFHVTADLLERHLFGEAAPAELLVGYLGDEICGYALFFRNFSSFRGRPGMYLEDIYVEPEARGHGLGRALLLEFLKIAGERDCARCEWMVLDWNERAKNFYESLGARPLEDWILYRMDEAALKGLLRNEHRKDYNDRQ